MTTTTAGRTVPYIVRVERGTLKSRHLRHRSAVRPDHARPGRRFAPQPQWNAKSSTPSARRPATRGWQFRSEQNWADDAALSRGFMVADNSLTGSLFNSNRVLNAETLMNDEGHIVDTYGEIKYTVGTACSAARYSRNTAASILPGPARRHPAGVRLPRLDHHRPRGHRLRAAGELLRRAGGTSLMAGLTQAQINAKRDRDQRSTSTTAAAMGGTTRSGSTTSPETTPALLVIDNTPVALGHSGRVAQQLPVCPPLRSTTR